MSGNQSALMGGDRTPASIVNGYSAGGAVQVCANPNLNEQHVATKTILSGALTAGTLKSLLSASGAGVIKFLSIYSIDTTSRTLRLKLTIDGVAVLDPGASAATTVIGSGLTAIGALIHNTTAGVTGITFEKVLYNSSFDISVASSLSETDKVAIAVNYEPR